MTLVETTQTTVKLQRWVKKKKEVGIPSRQTLLYFLVPSDFGKLFELHVNPDVRCPDVRHVCKTNRSQTKKAKLICFPILM